MMVISGYKEENSLQ